MSYTKTRENVTDKQALIIHNRITQIMILYTVLWVCHFHTDLPSNSEVLPTKNLQFRNQECIYFFYFLCSRLRYLKLTYMY